MEYYKKEHTSFEENLAEIHSIRCFAYLHKPFKREAVEPHCNCAGIYKADGKKVTSAVNLGEAHLKVTRVDSNGNCFYCGYYPTWRKEVPYKRSKK